MLECRGNKVGARWCTSSSRRPEWESPAPMSRPIWQHREAAIMSGLRRTTVTQNGQVPESLPSYLQRCLQIMCLFVIHAFHCMHNTSRTLCMLLYIIGFNFVCGRLVLNIFFLGIKGLKVARSNSIIINVGDVQITCLLALFFVCVLWFDFVWIVVPGLDECQNLYKTNQTWPTGPLSL